MPNGYSRQKPSLFWPLVLITVGVVLLLSNLGILPPDAINLLWRFWPLALVVIGLDILLGRRSAIGAIFTSLVAIALLVGVLAFVFFARNIPELTQQIDLGELRHQTIRAPLEGVETARVSIDWPSGPARLYALSDSNSLIEGDIAYFGTLYFDVQRQGTTADISLDSRIERFFIGVGNMGEGVNRWEVGLHPRVRYNLQLDASSGPGIYDLEELTIESLNVDAGSGPLTITLPRRGQVRGLIDGGSGPITLIVPRGMEARLTVDEGAGAFMPDRRFRQSKSEGEVTVWVTEGFVGADNYVELNIDGGSGSVRVE